MDLFARTLAALDWEVVLQALSRQARTLRGRAAAQVPDFAAGVDAVRARYAAVAEVWALELEGGTVPVGAVGDVGPAVERAARGAVLEPAELRDVGATLRALEGLLRWMEGNAARAPHLWALTAPVDVDPDLSDFLESAFDDAGELSGETFPELGDLREKRRALRDRIRAVLDELVHGDALAHALQDRYVTERGGRFVVPVKAAARKGIGIVHGSSQTGETVYVEPAAVVEATNEAREVEAAIEREERRILSWLSVRVGQGAPRIRVSLAAAEAVDLACARAGLGAALRGVVPRVGDEGVLHLLAARHPVLQLRGVEVVPNDLALDSRRRGLVLTGPNTGGKTVALKTIGLCALLARAGIPVPALASRDGSETRVDLFEPIVADVGDLQTVREDLSTFSGHLLVLDATLAAVRPGALVLLDEVGSGTDPAQGAALARAVMETLVEGGARVAVTTHYAELRVLGANDPRFVVAAAQLEDGRPTFRLEAGRAGASLALAIARRLGLPEAVLARARDHLDAGTRAVGDLLDTLEEERARVAQREREVHAIRDDLNRRERFVAEREAKVEERRRALERDVVRRAERRLAAREEQVKELVAALQERPDLRLAGLTLDRIRALRAKARADDERLAPDPPAAPPPSLAPGDLVAVRSLGGRGRVVALLPRGRVEVEVGRMRVKVDRDDLALPDEAAPSPPPPRPVREAAGPAAPARRTHGVPTAANTCDLRGQRAEDAIETVGAFLDALVLRGEAVAFVLHGHGTGALKAAVRAWLPGAPHVTDWRPADAGEGGDAYTIVGLG